VTPTVTLRGSLPVGESPRCHVVAVPGRPPGYVEGAGAISGTLQSVDRSHRHAGIFFSPVRISSNLWAPGAARPAEIGHLRSPASELRGIISSRCFRSVAKVGGGQSLQPSKRRPMPPPHAHGGEIEETFFGPIGANRRQETMQQLGQIGIVSAAWGRLVDVHPNHFH
jgi:hypothetical protein